MTDYNGKEMTRLLRGGDSVDEKIVDAAMAAMGEEMDAQSKKAHQLRSEFTEMDQTFSAELPTALAASSDALTDLFEARAKKLSDLRDQRYRSSELAEPVVREDQAKAFTGSIGDKGEASLDASVWQGFYFRPTVQSGILKIRTAPSYEYDIQTFSLFAKSMANFRMGILVQEFTVGGNDRVGTPVNAPVTIDAIDTWWFGDHRQGSNSAYGMKAETFVDNDHWYAVWVWAGANCFSASDGPIARGGGFSTIHVHVPSITWTLY